MPLDSVPKPYQLLPFRFRRLENAEQILLVNEVGESAFVSETTLLEMANGLHISNLDEASELRSKHFISDDDIETTLRLMSVKYRSKKAFLRGGQALHIFVVTLRCDHSCHYCQVSRVSEEASGFDMSSLVAQHAVDRVFETRSRSLTIEFQGGEPLLAFERIKEIVLACEERAAVDRRDIHFTITTTLHHATEEVLQFFKDHRFHVSVSIDGPDDIHNHARALKSGNSAVLTRSALHRARAILGEDRISSITTLTSEGLARIEEVIDGIVALGFRSLFLRSLSPHGFAVKSWRKIGYSTAEFANAYERAIRHILSLRDGGLRISEASASLSLGSILLPFAHTYVDLRSPAGAGLGTLVYDYDGRVFPSDEARMLAKAGDSTFCLGNVQDPLELLMKSDAMSLLLAAGVAEAIPGCSDCAYLPYCGADPVFHYATQGDPVGHRPSSDFCSKQLRHFDFMFDLLRTSDSTTRRDLTRWASGRG